MPRLQPFSTERRTEARCRPKVLEIGTDEDHAPLLVQSVPTYMRAQLGTGSMHDIRLGPPFRRATPDDAHELAKLVDVAGEGMPSYLWAEMAGPGENVWDVGRRRAQREEGSFSYRNAVLSEEDGRVVACLIGYRLPDEPEPIDYERMPAMFVPLQELENLAPGTWYVNVLAAYPEYRGRGYGTRLLGLAEELATASGSKGLSVIVSDANRGARRLYERCGYRVVAERAMVKEGWENAGTSWVLLVKARPTAAEGA